MLWGFYMNKMNYLKDQLLLIESVIPKKSRIIYLDYPLHLNVGDLLILKGAERFFYEMEYDVISRYSDLASKKFLEQNSSIDKDIVIVLHGGGNFGDLYPAHQNLRERVIAQYPENKIVILPQTLHFQDEMKMKESAKIFKKHSNLTIFCRDDKSFSILSEYFCSHVILCPDMAHSLIDVFPTQKKTDIKKDLLLMLRKDIEISSLPYNLNIKTDTETKSVDWDDICSDLDRFILKICHYSEILNGKMNRKIIPVNLIWYKYTDVLVSRVNAYFLENKEVVTSRMHGHILACLLGIRTKLIDNSYGKNSGYYKSWTNGIDTCELITNAE